MHRAPGRRSLAGIAAICLVGVAAALILQPVGCNQTAHLALVKALTNGTPRIDEYAAESCDTAYIDGHYYAAKAPGLALASFPWYGMLRLAGLAVDQTPRASGWPEAMLELPAAALGVLLLAVLLAPGVSSHSKWAPLVVLASGAIVGLSYARMAPRT